MMHGMIFAVINKIHCIALDDQIPHKLSGYKELLSGPVKFVTDIEDLPKAIKEILSKPYQEKDFSSYFDKLQKDLKGKRYET